MRRRSTTFATHALRPRGRGAGAQRDAGRGGLRRLPPGAGAARGAAGAGGAGGGGTGPGRDAGRLAGSARRWRPLPAPSARCCGWCCCAPRASRCAALRRRRRAWRWCCCWALAWRWRRGLPLWAIDLAGAAGGLRVAGVALAGAGLAALLWAWLELRARIWHPVNASARLAELQSRIRPHFLFNALNTALALVRVDPAQGRACAGGPERAVPRRAGRRRRRGVAGRGDRAGAGLPGDRAGAFRRPAAACDWDIDPAAGRARVPPLVLQPLVENAVRHGVEPAVDGGRVWVQRQRPRAARSW